MHDYRADDEDEYDDEVDNSFDYVPAVNYSESSEDFEGDEEENEETAVQQQEATHEAESPLGMKSRRTPRRLSRTKLLILWRWM